MRYALAKRAYCSGIARFLVRLGDGRGRLGEVQPHVEGACDCLERPGLLGHRIEVGPRVREALRAEALVRPREDDALVDVLDLPAFVCARFDLADIALQKRVEDVVCIHVVGALHGFDDEGAPPPRAGLGAVEGEQRVADRLGGMRVVDGKHRSREIERVGKLGFVVGRGGPFAGEERVRRCLGQAADHRPHARASVVELVVGRQRAVAGEGAAHGQERSSVVELAVKGVGALVVRADDRRRGRLVDRDGFELGPGLGHLAERVANFAAHEGNEILGHGARRVAGVELGEPRLRFVANPFHQAPLLPSADGLAMFDKQAERRRDTLGALVAHGVNELRVVVCSAELLELEVDHGEGEHRGAPAGRGGLTRQAAAREELLFHARVGVVDGVLELLHGPRRGDRAVERHGIDVEAPALRAGRDEALGKRRRVLAVPRCVGELLGRPRDGSAAGEGEGHAEEDTVVASVHGSVVVGVGEELGEIERAAVLAEGGLARDPRQLERDLRGLDRRGGGERDRLERRRGVAEEGRAHGRLGPRDGNVDEPAPVWGDCGARDVLCDDRTRREGRADGHLDDAQVCPDGFAVDERDVVAVDPLGLEDGRRPFEAPSGSAIGQVANAELPGHPLAKRNVKKGGAIGTHARPAHVGTLVEELIRAPVREALREHLGDRVAVRDEVERLLVGRKLPQEIVGDADGQAMRLLQVVVVDVVGPGACRAQRRREGRDRDTQNQHDFPCQVPSLPSTHPPQTTFSTWFFRHPRMSSVSDTSLRCSCIHPHSWRRARLTRSTRT